MHRHRHRHRRNEVSRKRFRTRPTLPAAPASSPLPTRGLCFSLGLGLFIQRAGNSTQLQTAGKHTKNTNTEECGEREFKERARRYKEKERDAPSHSQTHSHAHTHTTFLLSLTVTFSPHFLPCTAPAVNAGGVFGLPKSLHTFWRCFALLSPSTHSS